MPPGAAPLAFCHLSQGFRDRGLRLVVAPLIGLSPDQYGQGRMSYDDLRLRGLNERIPTRTGTALPTRACASGCATTAPARVLRPALSLVFDASCGDAGVNRAIAGFDDQVQRLWEGRFAA